MHELRIAESIVDIALKEINRRQLIGVRAVGVRIGALSGVDPEALEFGFIAITADTSLAGVKLEIENISVRGTCRACGRDFEIAEFVFVCPHCYATDIETSSGNELDITYLETD